jgi:hypothetical protein
MYWFFMREGSQGEDPATKLPTIGIKVGIRFLPAANP